MSISERAPKPGTVTANVLPHVVKGELTPTIREATRYSRQQVSRALREIDIRYFPRTRQEKERARREGIRLAKGGILLPVELFTEMGMATAEVQEVVREVFGVEPPEKKLQNRVRSARKSRPLTNEEIAHIKTSVGKNPPEVIHERVMFWLDTTAIVLTTMAKVPKTRMEWISLIEKYKNAGRISAEALRWRALVEGYARSTRQLPPDWSEIIALKKQRSENLSRSMRARWEKDEQYRKKHDKIAVIEPSVYPLALRRFQGWDIAMITGYDQKRTMNALRRMRAKGTVARPKPEEMGKAHTRAMIGRKKGEPRVATPEQLQMFQLIREFREAGLITVDLSDWQALSDLYDRYGRRMSEEPGERTILEMYMKALKAYVARNDEVPAIFKRIVSGVDHTLLRNLAPEMGFIKLKLFCSWADGEDSKGVYSLREGMRQYRIVENGDGMVYDTSTLAMQRARIRNKIVPDRKRVKRKKE